MSTVNGQQTSFTVPEPVEGNGKDFFTLSCEQ